MPVAVPWAEPLVLALSPDVFTVPVADPVAVPDACVVSVSPARPVVRVVSVDARPVSGPVSTFAWFFEQAASDPMAAKVRSNR